MSPFEPCLSWVLERAATEFADGEGTVDLDTGERMSWAETSRRVAGVAAGLRDMGLDAGDRVGVLALNSARHFELWDDVAAIFYTGGTTGLAKGAMLTHRNLTSNALHIIATLQFSPEDRYLHCGPQFHLADGTFAYGVTWMGGTHVFIPAFDPNGTIEAIAAEQITMSLMVPTMINLLLQSPSVAGADLSSLRAVLYGASPMPIRRCRLCR